MNLTRCEDGLEPDRVRFGPRASLTQTAYDGIKALLLDSQGSGAAFSERQLSAQLGLGLAPIRAALSRLRAEELIVVVPNAGIRLPDLPPRAILDFYELRTALETHVVSALAARGVAARLGPIRELLDEQEACVRAGDAKAYHHKDMAFHRALAELHGNAEIVRVLSGLRDRMQRLSSVLHAGHPDRLSANFGQHVAILDAIAAGDAAAAVGRLRDHLSHARDLVMDPLARTRDPAKPPYSGPFADCGG